MWLQKKKRKRECTTDKCGCPVSRCTGKGPADYLKLNTEYYKNHHLTYSVFSPSSSLNIFCVDNTGPRPDGLDGGAVVDVSRSQTNPSGLPSCHEVFIFICTLVLLYLQLGLASFGIRHNWVGSDRLTLCMSPRSYIWRWHRLQGHKTPLDLPTRA
jgi:hypothetical protein